MTTFSSPVPKGCVLTSPFGNRTLGGVTALHAGTDWDKPGAASHSIPVFAPADGRVEQVGYGYGGYDSEVMPYHTGRGIKLDHGSIGGDRMRSYFGHLAEVHVSEGESVVAGQQIGIIGGSGPSGEHHFAEHLHFGVCQNEARPVGAAQYYGDPGWIDSHTWLKSKGVEIGGDEPVDPGTTSAAAGSSGGSSSGSSSDRPDDVVDAETLHDRFDAMGYGRSEWPGPRTELYQDAQLYGDLVVDRHWGDVTEAHYQWTRTLQDTMNAWKGGDVPVDGDYRSVTDERVWEIQRRNEGGAYQGAVDGIPGRITCQMLGIPTHPNL